MAEDEHDKYRLQESRERVRKKRVEKETKTATHQQQHLQQDIGEGQAKTGEAQDSANYNNNEESQESDEKVRDPELQQDEEDPAVLFSCLAARQTPLHAEDVLLKVHLAASCACHSRQAQKMRTDCTNPARFLRWIFLRRGTRRDNDATNGGGHSMRDLRCWVREPWGAALLSLWVADSLQLSFL